MSRKNATIITIGDELLIGQVIDTNSAWIAQQLNSRGIAVHQRVAIADEREAITGALRDAIRHSDIVLLTGGLGPTSDDITKPVLCDFFGGQLVVNEAVLEQVRDIFLKRNKPLLERNLKQAEVPDVCTVIHNPRGTAPGMLFRQQHTIIVSMPGVPMEMKGMMSDTVLPLLEQEYGSENAIVHRNILTFGEGESFLAEQISDIEAALPPYIKLAYLPSPYSVKLRLSAYGNDEAALTRETEYFRDAITQRVSKHVVSCDDLPLEEIMSRALWQKNLSLGLAESCTGGHIAHKITQVNGASVAFKGGIVSYATEAKINILGIPADFIQQHGVVSAEVASAMADSARKVLKADIGLGITGILSKGPYEDSSPVGTVFIAVSSAGHALVKSYRLHYDRAQNKETATQIALYLLWKFITKEI